MKNPRKIQQFATIADVHKDIMDFPQQYQTIVGERGVTPLRRSKAKDSYRKSFNKRTKNPYFRR